MEDIIIKNLDKLNINELQTIFIISSYTKNQNKYQQ
jgi:hypothetical protein